MHWRRHGFLYFATALGLIALVGLSIPAHAQSVWGGSGSTTATSNYNTATNWSNPPGVAPSVPGTAAVFANTGQTAVNVGSAINPNSWMFSTGAQSYTFTGSAVTFNTNTGLINNAGAGTSISIANSLRGSASLTQNGAGTLTLSGANSYTGATTISAGTLAIGAGGSISNSSVVTANGTFDVSGSSVSFNLIKTLAGFGVVQLGANSLVITAGSTEFSGSIQDGGNFGGLEITHGTQTLSGVNTYLNVTQINSGATLAIKGNGSIANSAYVGFLGAGTLDISQTNGGTTVSGLFGSGGTVSLGSQTLTIGSAGTFFGGVVKDGGIAGGTGGGVTIMPFGDQQFYGTNTYTGATTIDTTGELDLINSAGHNGSIATSSGVIANGVFDISSLSTGTTVKSLSGTNSSAIVYLGGNRLTLTNAAGTFAGAISDGGINGGTGGSLAITSGTETLTGISTYTGGTTVANATLVVNGSIGDPTINAGGVLAGTGTVGSSQINAGGTLAPGSATMPLGTLSIVGNLAFNSGSAYNVAIASSGSNSKVAVTGGATLGGNGTVAVTPGVGYYAAGTQYQILTTTTGVGGQFAGLTIKGGFNGAMGLDYTHTNDVYVDITQAGYVLFTPPSGANQNQQNVFTGINNAIAGGGSLPAGFVNFANISGPAFLNALTQLDGEVATGAEHGAITMMTQFLDLMLDPFVDGRFGSNSGGGGQAIGFAPDEDQFLPSDVALAYASILNRAGAAPAPFVQRWTSWGASYGGGNFTSGNATVGSSNVTSQIFGFAGGMDYHYSPDTIFGFALGGSGLNWGLAGGLGSGQSQAFQSGVYGITRFGPAYLAASLSFANHWMTTNRVALGDQLNANFIAQSYGARVESGYRYAVLPAFGVTPYGALQVQDFHTPGYSESDLTGGGLGLSYASMNATDVRTEIGARLDSPMLIAGTPVILRARLAWAHDFVSNPSLSAVFESLPGSNFVVNGAAIPNDSALVSAGAEFYLTARWSLLAKFDGEFASGSQTYAGTGTLRYVW